MQVVVTVAGFGQRFKDEGYSQPKPVVSVMGKAAISYLIESFSPKWNLIFAVGEHYQNTAIEKEIKHVNPGANVVYVKHSVRGPIDTVQAALPRLNKNEPVAVSYCDYAMIWKPVDFEMYVQQTDCDICIPAYKGFHPTYLGPNTYAHLQVQETSNHITKIQEKKLFGKYIEDEWSSPGFYFFKSVELLKKGLDLQIKTDLKYGAEFYTSLAAQALMNEDVGLKVLQYPISHFLQMGTPADVSHAEYWHKYIAVDQKKNTFSPDTQDDKLYRYWSYVFKNLPL